MWEMLIPLFGKIFDKVMPDPAAAAAAKLEVMRLAQTGELAQLTADTQLAVAQIDVNKAEATNPSLFVSGWRPFIGWVCGTSCAWNWIGLSIAKTIALAFFATKLDLQPASITEMMPILAGLLGLGSLRTYEKIKGVAAV